MRKSGVGTTCRGTIARFGLVGVLLLGGQDLGAAQDATPPRCQTWVTDSHAGVSADDLAALKQCASALKSDVDFARQTVAGSTPASGTQAWAILFTDLQQLTPDGERLLAETNRAGFALEAHGAYERIRSLGRKAKDDARKRSAPPHDLIGELDRATAELRRDVHALMDEVDVRRPFAAVLEPSVTVKKASADQDTQLQASTLIRFESRRLRPGDGTGGFSVGAGGRIGYRPVQAMVAGEATEGMPPPAPSSALKTAFSWDLGPSINQRLGKWIELSAFGRAGQTFLTDETTITQPDGETPFLSLPVDEQGDKWKWFFDGGIRLAVSPRPSGKIEETRLTPDFEVVFGWRRDNRFRDQSGLAGPFTLDSGTVGGGFVQPQRRHFFRFALNGLKVLKGAGDSFSLSFAVEHEWQRGGMGTGLPPVTTVYVGGNLDLLKILGGKAEEKEEEKTEGESTETGGAGR